jgi:hypothetical protein
MMSTAMMMWALWYTTSGTRWSTAADGHGYGAKTITAPKTIRLRFPLRLQAQPGQPKPGTFEAYATVTLEIELNHPTAVYDSRCHISRIVPGL